jgi:hypothetical protein
LTVGVNAMSLEYVWASLIVSPHTAKS